jgi:hypothetical protein
VSTPINLNKARKIRARAAKRVQADENAVKFGRSKAEKEVLQLQKQAAKRHLDGHQKDT